MTIDVAAWDIPYHPNRDPYPSHNLPCSIFSNPGVPSLTVPNGESVEELCLVVRL